MGSWVTVSEKVAHASHWNDKERYKQRLEQVGGSKEVKEVEGGTRCKGGDI